MALEIRGNTKKKEKSTRVLSEKNSTAVEAVALGPPDANGWQERVHNAHICVVAVYREEREGNIVDR